MTPRHPHTDDMQALVDAVDAASARARNPVTVPNPRRRSDRQPAGPLTLAPGVLERHRRPALMVRLLDALQVVLFVLLLALFLRDDPDNPDTPRAPSPARLRPAAAFVLFLLFIGLVSLLARHLGSPT